MSQQLMCVHIAMLLIRAPHAPGQAEVLATRELASPAKTSKESLQVQVCSVVVPGARAACVYPLFLHTGQIA